MGIIDNILGRARRIGSGARRSGSDLRFKSGQKFDSTYRKADSLDPYGKGKVNIPLLGISVGFPALAVIGIVGYWFFIR